MDHLRASIAEDDASSANKHLPAVRSLLRQGESVCSAARSADAAIAPVALFTYLYFLVGGVLYLYGSFSVLLVPDRSPSNWAPLLLAAGNMLASTGFYLTVQGISATGHIMKGYAIAYVVPGALKKQLHKILFAFSSTYYTQFFPIRTYF